MANTTDLIVVTWKNRLLSPRRLINTFHSVGNIYNFSKKCHLFVQFLGAGIVDETTYRRTGKEFYDLLFVDHFSLRL